MLHFQCRPHASQPCTTCRTYDPNHRRKAHTEDRTDPHAATDKVKVGYETAKQGFWFDVGAVHRSHNIGHHFDVVLAHVSGSI